VRLRILRFGSVGLVSTAIHAACLILLTTLTSLGGGLANVVSFVIAFAFSFKAQQMFTFADRLGKQQLNLLALSVLFVFNVAAALVLGTFLNGRYKALLPLAPAAINYILFYLTSGLPQFRR
jgi:putative flippase GtrA